MARKKSTGKSRSDGGSGLGDQTRRQALAALGLTTLTLSAPVLLTLADGYVSDAEATIKKGGKKKARKKRSTKSGRPVKARKKARKKAAARKKVAAVCKQARRKAKAKPRKKVWRAIVKACNNT